MPPEEETTHSTSTKEGEKKRVSEEPYEDQMNKRHQASHPTAANNVASTPVESSNASLPKTEVEDVCLTLGLNAGDRVEVLWTLHPDEEEEDGDNSGEGTVEASSAKAGNNEGTPPTTNGTITGTHNRWWGATLLPHDGRVHVLCPDENEEKNVQNSDAVTVPIRVLDYDPYPDGGFQERSKEDVAFLSAHSILNIGSGSSAYFRREGTDWEAPQNEDENDPMMMAADDLYVSATTPSSREDALRTVLDTVLARSLINMGAEKKMLGLTAAQRCVVAERIAQGKERLLETMRGHEGVITGDHMRQFMEEAWQNM